MRNKAPLTLMEQIVMIAVFALAAALCLQAFVKSDTASRKSETRDQAVLVCQSVAEVLRHYGQDGGMEDALQRTAEQLGGQYSQGVLRLDYDQAWEPVDKLPPDGYRLEVYEVSTETAGLCKAAVRVVSDVEANGASEVLFELEVAWQEVSGNG